MSATTGRILHLQRLSTEDGPGLRTTVFFKGCPLRCAWCHNPESLSARVQVQWYAARCLGCRTCLAACPRGALALTAEGLVIDRARCDAGAGCNAACAEACPANALEALGKTVTADGVLRELLKDRAYYAASGGGVTLSGGEPTLQPDFAEALLRGLQAHGIATALDTCGLCSSQVLDRLLPFTDLVLYDLKLFEPGPHQAFTGQPNEPILENLLYLHELIQSQSRSNCRSDSRPLALWIRTPLIPGATGTDSNLRALGGFLAQRLNGTVKRWELCAFNNLCRDKYLRLGLAWAYAQQPLMTAAELAQCEHVARASGVSPEIVSATGAAAA
jgi:pyruvate formate lyase activating enzyme